MAIELPTKKIPALTQDPKNLILFGAPKVGKTSILSCLDDLLILDLEKGSDYVDAMKIRINSLQELLETCKAIEAAGKPYKFIALDTVTALVEIAKPLALKDYLDSPGGKNFTGKDVLTAAHGAGYGFLKTAIQKIISRVSQVTDHVIIVGHVKVTSIDDGDTSDITKNLDLPGNSKRALAADSDAIGYVYRDDKSNLCINFTADGVECGARPQHLANQQIIVAERQEDGTFISHWDRIYPSLKQD